MSGASETSGAIHRTRAITCSSLSGWRIEDDLIVASLFAERQGSLFRFRLNQAGKQVRTRVDFREEYRQPVPHQSMLSWSINSSRPTERIGVASAARCFFRRCSRPASGASSKI
ncbi:hypothetical protein ACV343_32395, partial [Pseudomonas aeruginosa]